jgi:hypothetical protein
VLRYRFKGSSGEQLLMTRRVVTSKRHFTMLLIVRPLSDSRLEIGEAYRLYDGPADRSELHRHPMAAFETLIDRFGVPFGFPSPHGARTIVTFVQAARVALPDDDPMSLIKICSLPRGVNALSGTSSLRFVTRTPPICDVEWLWFLDADRYRSEVRSGSR